MINLREIENFISKNLHDLFHKMNKDAASNVIKEFGLNTEINQQNAQVLFKLTINKVDNTQINIIIPVDSKTLHKMNSFSILEIIDHFKSEIKKNITIKKPEKIKFDRNILYEDDYFILQKWKGDEELKMVGHTFANCIRERYNTHYKDHEFLTLMSKERDRLIVYNINTGEKNGFANKYPSLFELKLFKRLCNKVGLEVKDQLKTDLILPDHIEVRPYYHLVSNAPGFNAQIIFDDEIPAERTLINNTERERRNEINRQNRELARRGRQLNNRGRY